jgi:stage II sporulation protein D
MIEPSRPWQPRLPVPLAAGLVAVSFLLGTCSASRPTTSAPNAAGSGVGDKVQVSEPLPGATPTPTPTIEPTPPPPGLQPPAEAKPLPRRSGPFLLRVGLASDLPRVVLPCCDGEVSTDAGGETFRAGTPFVVEPDAKIARQGVFRLQIAALKDEVQAGDLARRIAQSSGAPADAVFDAATDLYRVRVGRSADRAEIEALQRRLSLLGVDVSWVVTEGGGLGEAGFRVTQNGHSRRAEGRWLSVQAGEGGVRFEGRRYRGRLLLYLNDRGTLNAINEVPLEEYLRGVVPREMGPRVFDRIEALKAQAVAARTYALRTLGEFAEEGYDLCATPRCQVYGGMEDEDALSDRAVADTAGQVLVAGSELVDALYSSTCGGHTEDVERIFPLKRASYLRGVPCVEAGGTRWANTANPAGTAGTPAAAVAFPEALLRRLVGEGSTVARAAKLAQLVARDKAPKASHAEAPQSRRELLETLTQIWGLSDDVGLFVSDEDLRYFFPQPPPGWSRGDLERAALFVKLGLLTNPADRPLTATEATELLLRAAVYLGAVEEIAGNYRELRAGQLTLATKDGEVERPVDAATGVFRATGAGSAAIGQPIELIAGDRLRAYARGGALLAVVQEVDPQGAAADRTSSRASWTRRPSFAELSSAVRLRYPGFDFQDLDILERGRSGRVSKIRLRSATQPPVEVEGLAVRWTLNLPDTWFSMKRTSDAEGRPSWLFQGRGWGHGVGMCQVGSYGMALRGRTFDEILRHYYTGVRLERLDELASRRGPSLPADAAADWRWPNAPRQTSAP